jgi:hypothetical protein
LAHRSLDNLIADSQVIVVGEVLSLGPHRWNTPDGRLPEPYRSGKVPFEMIIFSDAQFRVTQTLKGEVPNPILQLRMFGGTVEDITVELEAQTQLLQGAEYLLFLMLDETGTTAQYGPGHYYLLTPSFQTFTILDGRAVSEEEEWVLEDLIQHITERVGV